MAYHILVVDDDKRLRELLSKYLEGEGFVVSTSKDAESARRKIQNDKPDLVVLDVMMPGESGIVLSEKIKETSTLPILMLTAMGETEDRIKGLESGADDYLVKPFEPRELCLRIEKLLERKKQNHKIVRFGDYIFNIENGDLRRGEKIIKLTSASLTLLTIFAEKINKPIMREELSKKLNNISERSVDVQITRLRKQIEEDPKDPVYLQTDRGKGYILRSRN